MQTHDIKPIVFLYLSGAIDILLTIICIYMGWGYETTTLYTWISPVWLMCLFMVLANTIFCLFMAVAYTILQKNHDHPFAKPVLLLFAGLFYLGGMGRMVFGTGSCLYVMMLVLV
jgi:hypothetical protein